MHVLLLLTLEAVAINDPGYIQGILGTTATSQSVCWVWYGTAPVSGRESFRVIILSLVCRL